MLIRLVISTSIGSRVDSSVPLMHRDASDLGSMILFRIIPKERALLMNIPHDQKVPAILPRGFCATSVSLRK